MAKLPVSIVSMDRLGWRRAALRATDGAGVARAPAAGFTVIEALIGLALVAVLFAIATPNLRARYVNILTAEQLVLSNLRLARSHAITRGVHYQVEITESGLEIARMVQVVDQWQVDPAREPEIAALPPNIRFTAATGVGGRIEFNTRGIAVNLETVKLIAVEDVESGAVRDIQAWPSGQINAV